jgi:ribosome recycling factor
VEEAKIALRNIRREALDDLREFEKEKIISEDDFYRGRDNLQDLIDNYNEQMEETGNRKARDVMEA